MISFSFYRLAGAAQLGQASVDHIPRELRIMGRTILTQKGKTKWYDLPLTEQEIEHGGTVGEPPRRVLYLVGVFLWGAGSAPA